MHRRSDWAKLIFWFLNCTRHEIHDTNQNIFSSAADAHVLVLLHLTRTVTAPYTMINWKQIHCHIINNKTNVHFSKSSYYVLKVKCIKVQSESGQENDRDLKNHITKNINLKEKLKKVSRSDQSGSISENHFWSSMKMAEIWRRSNIGLTKISELWS